MNRYQIKAKGDAAAELLIYGDIGDKWDDEQTTDAISVVRALEQYSHRALTIRINSFGGSVADGLAIYNAIKNHRAPTIAKIDGVAFSVASMIPMAAQKIEMAENAIMMIHAPWGGAVGNARDMREMADTLDQFADAMAASYKRPGVDAEIIAKWLRDGVDHYLTADQAIEAGLADTITESIDIAAALRTVDRYQPPQGTSKMEQSAMSEKPEATGGPNPTPAEDFIEKHKATLRTGEVRGAKQERDRIRAVTELFAGLDDPDGELVALRDACIDDGASLAVSQNRIIAMLKERTGSPIQGGIGPDTGAGKPGGRPARERITSAADTVDKLIQGATIALQIKTGLETNQEIIAKERGSEFLSMSLLELGKHCMRAEGKPVSGTATDVARQIVGAGGGPGLGSDHFPAILENIANKSVMDGYMSAPETWQQWTQPGVLNDYRPASRVNKSLFETLDKMEEFERFKHGRFADVKQSITGFLHGKSFSITIQALVNDDLGMLTDDGRSWGEAANATIGDAVFLLLSASGTGGYGQTMDEDSTLLFHADHSNYIASGSGAAPDATTIGAARTAMMTQDDPNGRKVASIPRFLIHGTALTLPVIQLLNSQNYITGASATMGEVNPVRSLGLQGVEERRIDDFVSTAWYMAAARRTVEVAFVGGQRQPMVVRMPPGEIPGVTWQISIPFGVAALDWRTMYLNYGA